jgi:hypothetical protein
MFFVRRLVCIFLLLLLPLHGFAMQGGWFSAENGFDLAHEIEHVEGKSHHHADDGSVHYDDSSESTKHFSEHSASQQSPALPSLAVPQLIIAPLMFAIGEPAHNIPDPDLERPQRPPSTLG